jgi:hypothetical protein
MNDKSETIRKEQLVKYLKTFFPNGATAPSGPGPPHYRGFTITLSWTHHTR